MTMNADGTMLPEGALRGPSELESLRAQLSVARAQAASDRALIAELRSAMTTCLTQLVGWQVLADPTDGATKDDQYAIANARAVLGKVAPTEINGYWVKHD